MDIERYISKAVEKLKSFPRSTRVRIVSHYDTDGISSAAILLKSLEREGFDFHVTLLNHPFREEIEKLKKEENDLIIFSDLGSGQIEQIREIGVDSIILDHHQPEIKDVVIENVIQINSNLFSIDGNFEISGAGVSYLFARSLDNNNIDLSVFSLLGAIGDKQSLGGFKGINKTIFDDARKNDLIRLSKPSLKIGNRELIDEITNSVDPFYPGLSGRVDEVRRLLSKLSIPEDSTYGELNKDERRKLHSFLIMRLLEKKIEPEVADEIIKERIIAESLPSNLDILAEIIDSCSKGGYPGIALAFCLNSEKFYENIIEESTRYKKLILSKLVELEDGKIREGRNMVYFLAENASQGSFMSGIVSNYFDCKGKAVFSFTDKNGKIHVSCRARRRDVEKGLDLGSIMRRTAERFAGSGGGHKIAAGGTFENVSLNELISFIDDQLEVNK